MDLFNSRIYDGHLHTLHTYILHQESIITILHKEDFYSILETHKLNWPVLPLNNNVSYDQQCLMYMNNYIVHNVYGFEVTNNIFIVVPVKHKCFFDLNSVQAKVMF